MYQYIQRGNAKTSLAGLLVWIFFVSHGSPYPSLSRQHGPLVRWMLKRAVTAWTSPQVPFSARTKATTYPINGRPGIPTSPLHIHFFSRIIIVSHQMFRSRFHLDNDNVLVSSAYPFPEALLRHYQPKVDTACRSMLPGPGDHWHPITDRSRVDVDVLLK